VLVSFHFPTISCTWLTHCSLEKDPARRATPWRMLEHPWMKEIRGKRVNMARFLAQVWGWEEEQPAKD